MTVVNTQGDCMADDEHEIDASWDPLKRGVGELAERMGIKIVKMTAEHAIATMPADGNRQPVGLIHGGAFAVLGETLGSFAANVWAGPDKMGVGIELNASHTGNVAEGIVTGEATAIHLGRTLTVHEVAITSEDGKRLSTVRITNFILPRR